MKSRTRNAAALAVLGALCLAQPHVLRTTVCRLDRQGTCNLAWCIYRGAKGERSIHFNDGAAPSFCWPVRLFAFDRPQR